MRSKANPTAEREANVPKQYLINSYFNASILALNP